MSDSKHRFSVLLIDSEPQFAGPVQEALIRMGCAVKHFLHPKEILPFGPAGASSLENFDLLITDVVMPYMNGRDLARFLRAKRADMKVLYTSAYSPDLLTSHGLLERGAAFLGKPVELQALLGKVQQMLHPAPVHYQGNWAANGNWATNN